MLAKKDPRQDRRDNIYRFHTLHELLDLYSDFLSTHQMEAVIRDSGRIFVERDTASEQETRLQFIKKCEYIMETLVSMKEAGIRHGMAG
jgi:hypothetical protein